MCRGERPEALNQMHEELQEKRRSVEAHQRQACLQVIRQKADKAREQLRQMDAYLASIEADPNYLPEQYDLKPLLHSNPPPLHPNPPHHHHHLIFPGSTQNTFPQPYNNTTEPTSADTIQPKIPIDPDTPN